MKRKRNRRAAFLRNLTKDERAALVFIPDDFATLLEQIPAEEARAEIRRFMECMTRRGYDTAHMAEAVADER